MFSVDDFEALATLAIDDEKQSTVQKISSKEAMDLSLEHLNTFSQHIDGYRERTGQLTLMSAVSEAMAAKRLLVAQAGTGTGKTFAYVLGALPYVLENKQRLIISTHTIALQSQLVEKDLPLIQEHVAPQLKVEIAKGGTRYFCPKRAHELLAKTEEDSQLELSAVVNTERLAIKAVKEVWGQFQDKAFDGDLDTFSGNDQQLVEEKTQRLHNRCAGQRTCKFAQECPFYAQRERLKNADVVVTNHALLSHVVSNDTKTLGELNECNLVLDEAHQFHDVFRDHHAHHVVLNSESGLDKSLQALNKAVSKIYKNYPAMQQEVSDSIVQKLFQTLEPLVTEYVDQTTGLDAFLRLNFKALRGPVKNQFDDAHQWVLDHNPTQADFSQLLTNYLAVSVKLAEVLAQFSLRVTNPMEKAYPHATEQAKQAVQTLVVSTRELIEEMNNTVGCVKRYVQFDEFHSYADRVESGLIRWVNFDSEQKAFCLSSNDLDVSQAFKKQVHEQFSSVVLTSATIESMGTFSFFNAQLGIHSIENHKLINVESPFDYSRVNVSAPIIQGDVNSPNYAQKIAAQVGTAIQRHKAVLVLFSSYRQLEQALGQCTPSVQKNILSQRTFSKSRLLAEHKKRIDSGQTSILFGVDGLAEGVDLKKQYLTCVMVAKFPFPHLGEPMMQGQTAYLEAKGRNSFLELSLPLCSRKLIQSTGRLIRTEEDYGEVMILDSRVHSKRYARQLVTSLPICN
ncbi:ATP-dependent DNA helicase [Vibrio breoganii]